MSVQPSSQENPCFFRFGGKDAKVNISSRPKLAVTSPRSPDDSPEQTLKVKMPQGSTERSKKLIVKQKQAAATAAGRFEDSFCFKTKNIYLAIYCVFPGRRTVSKRV